MTAEQKAIELKERCLYILRMYNEESASKALARLIINEVESSLIEYGEKSFELQNMENDFRWLDKVRNAI